MSVDARSLSKDSPSPANAADSPLQTLAKLLELPICVDLADKRPSGNYLRMFPHRFFAEAWPPGI